MLAMVPSTPDTSAAALSPGGGETELLRAMLTRVDPRDPGAFNNLGVLYHARGLHQEAVEAFLRALALDPRMRTATRNLEIAARQPGACDARLARIAARLAANPDDREALHERARLARLTGDLPEARRQLDMLVAENPDDADALFERGLVEHRAGDLRRAQRWLERAVHAGADVDAATLLAEVHYQRGQNEQALAVLESVLREHPDRAEAHRLRGFVLGDMGRHDDALEAARTAARLNPALDTVEGDLALHDARTDRVTGVVAGESPADTQGPLLGVAPDGALPHYGLGLAFRQRGYFREARREFERAEAGGEDARLVAHALAELDLVDGRAAAARDRYRALLEVQPSARWWNEHGVACHQAGDTEGAASSYRRALHLDPRYALALNNLGVLLADRGDEVAALEALARAAELDATLVLARLNQARVLGRRAEILPALTLLRELVLVHPREAEAWHTMGVILAQRGRPADAREALVRAIDQRPTHAEARFALAQVLATLGDDDGAARETQAALGLASYRAEVRLQVGIELQRECPDAVGPIDLLRVAGGAPLEGVAIARGSLDAMLPESRACEAPELGEADRAQQACDQADAFAARTLHGEALDRYRDARERLEGDGDAVALWRRAATGEARSLCLLKRARTARGLLARLAADAPHDPELCVLQAAALLDLQDGDRARAMLFRVLRQEVSSGALLHYAGDIALAIGDTGMAMAFFRRALARDPSRPSPRVAIARLLRERGDLLAARLELAAALAAAPQWREALLELAMLHAAGGAHSDARRLLASYLQRVPTDLDAMVLLAEMLVHEARDDDARLVVARVLRHDPANVAARWYEGVLHANHGRRRDAKASWSLLLAGDTPSAWRHRAERALARLDADEAEPAAYEDVA